MDFIELEQIDNGTRVRVPAAHWARWPQIAESFRPVAEVQVTTVADISPTGDDMKEN